MNHQARNEKTFFGENFPAFESLATCIGGRRSLPGADKSESTIRAENGKSGKDDRAMQLRFEATLSKEEKKGKEKNALQKGKKVVQAS